MRQALLFVTTAVPVLLGSVAAHAQNFALASHRAVYDLKMDQTKDTEGVLDARGRIVLEFKNTCDGYVTSQRMVMEIDSAHGRQIVSDMNLSTWENKQGDSLRFTVVNRINGKIVEESDGIATVQKDTGEVSFSDPKTETLVLPANVLLPSAHMLEILRVAANEGNIVSSRIYDGTGPDGLNDSLTVIGRKPANPSKAIKEKDMDKLRSWPVLMSFAKYGDTKTEPDYKVKFRLYENGVGDEIYLDYSDFSLNGKLSTLDVLEKQKCN